MGHGNFSQPKFMVRSNGLCYDWAIQKVEKHFVHDRGARPLEFALCEVEPE